MCSFIVTRVADNDFGLGGEHIALALIAQYTQLTGLQTLELSGT